MPGTLKLNPVASIYYNSHKPYNWFRSFTTVTGTGISNSSIAAAAAHTRYSLYIHSPSRRKFLGRLGHRYADFVVRSISTTQMGPTPDHKEEDLRREKPSLPIPSKSEKLLTLPTILTIGRVAAVPLLVTTFYVDSWWGPTATTAIFIAAAVTDWLDGYLARKILISAVLSSILSSLLEFLFSIFGISQF